MSNEKTKVNEIDRSLYDFRYEEKAVAFMPEFFGSIDSFLLV